MKKEFEEIYREYFPRVFAFLFKLTQNQDLSEELTQETFYQAFVSFYRFRGDSDVFTWLASIAKHTYYRHLRKSKHTLSTISMDQLAEIYYDEESGLLEERIEQQQILDKTKEAMSQLPKKYQDVMLLRVYAELSYTEIGNVLHISENSARVIYFRAKKMILEAIQNEL